MILKNGNSCPSPVIKHNLYIFMNGWPLELKYWLCLSNCLWGIFSRIENVLQSFKLLQRRLNSAPKIKICQKNQITDQEIYILVCSLVIAISVTELQSCHATQIFFWYIKYSQPIHKVVPLSTMRKRTFKLIETNLKCHN